MLDGFFYLCCEFRIKEGGNIALDAPSHLGLPLVMDVGFNDGSDSSIYLALGYKVVAIEANSFLVERGNERFVSEIEENRLTIVNIGLPLRGKENETQATFYKNKVNDEWSSLLREVGCRGTCWGSNVVCRQQGQAETPTCCAGPEFCIEARIPIVDCGHLFEEFGVPFFLKLDVEGGEMSCLTALSKFERRPRFVSTEVSPDSWHHWTEMIRLGYSGVKAVPQKGIRSSGLPPALSLDCTAGAQWRPLVLDNYFNPFKNCSNNAGWYDWHFFHAGKNGSGIGPGHLVSPSVQA